MSPAAGHRHNPEAAVHTAEQEPLVSVVMPVYNGERYLRQAVDSILDQNYQNLELIVVDDGSSDGSKALLESYSDERLVLLANPRNLGVVQSRNLGIAVARGSYVALLDCDDVAMPDRLREQISFLEHHPEFGMVGSWVEVVDSAGVPTGEVWRLDAPSETIPMILLLHNYFTQSAVTVRRSCFNALQYREFGGATDYDLWVRLAAHYRVWNLPQVLVRYRIHQGSMTAQGTDSLESQVRQVVRQCLSGLGIEPDSVELELHRRIGSLDVSNDAAFLSRCGRWLTRLYRSNCASRLYPDDAFRTFLGETWFSLCSAASTGGWPVARVFFSSRLSLSANRTWTDLWKFTACCVRGKSFYSNSF